MERWEPGIMVSCTELGEPKCTYSLAQVVRYTCVEHGVKEHPVLDKFWEGQCNHETKGNEPEGQVFVE